MRTFSRRIRSRILPSMDACHMLKIKKKKLLTSKSTDNVNLNFPSAKTSSAFQVPELLSLFPF